VAGSGGLLSKERTVMNPFLLILAISVIWRMPLKWLINAVFIEFRNQFII